MKDTKQARAHQLMAACETLLKNNSMKDVELLRGALDLAKAYYGREGSNK